MDSYPRGQEADLGRILAKGWIGIEVKLGMDRC